jgi:hypothetical protein
MNVIIAAAWDPFLCSSFQDQLVVTYSSRAYFVLFYLFLDY